MDDNPSPTKKRRRGDHNPTSSRPTWITPTFDGGISTSKQKPEASQFVNPPKFTFTPTGFQVPSPSPSKPKLKSSNLPTPKALPIQQSRPIFKPPNPPQPKLFDQRGTTPLSSIKHRPSKPPTTPVKEDLKPLAIPTKVSLNPKSETPFAPSVAQQPPGSPLKTPLTTRLASITTVDTSSSQTDEKHLDQRTAIANQVRVKQEELDNPHTSRTGEWEEVEDLFRGITFSPEKIDRSGKRKGFVKNGLAERAYQVIAHAQNDFSLWSHEMSRTLPDPNAPFSSSSAPTRRRTKAPPPDMRLVITRILSSPATRLQDEPGLHARTALARYCLTKCRITNPTSKAGEAVPVMFSFSPSGALASYNISPALGFEVDREVVVWKPWITVSVPDQDASSVTGEATHDAGGQTPSTTDALLCSRYMIIQKR